MTKFIPWAKPDLNSIDKKYLIKAFNSNWISGGSFVKNLEKSVSKFVNSKYAISVNNGTSAIDLIYNSIGLKPGDEIIVPGYGYMAASNLALQRGIKPIFCDVELDTFCIDPKKLEKKISKKTKIIVAINTYGNVCRMNEIKKIANKNNLYVIEDAAESFGSTLNKKQSGTFGDFGTFSFQATKTITTGEGGIVITSLNKNIYKTLTKYRNHGVDKKRYLHLLPGGNYRLTNLQAALGYSQLKRINKIKHKRKKIFEMYKSNLKSNKNINFQIFTDNVDPLVWTIGIRLNNKKKINRDKIIRQLYRLNIEARNGFYTPNKLEIYKKFYSNDLHNSDNLSNNVICLPLFNKLTEKEIIYICKKFNKIID